MSRRGIALVSVLIMSSLLLIMVIALYASSRGGVLSSVSHMRRTAALYTAEAGLADTMDALEASNFALTNGPLSGSLPGVGGTWTVEFNDAAPFSELQSVNNLNGDAAVEGYRGVGTVPRRSALIVVRARVGDMERVLEATVARAGLGINTQNALQAGGNLVVAGNVKVDGVRSLTDTTPVPENVHSNAGSGTAVQWDGIGTADISGTVSAVATGAGAIDLNGYTPAGGPPTTGAGVATFPTVDIPGLVAAKSSAPNPAIPALGSHSLAGGDYYQSGNTTINGDLVLTDGAHLYIDGNLTVNGSITGEGSVTVTGTTTLQGSSQVNAGPTQQVALFSGGDVTLTGFNGTQYLEALAASDPQAQTFYTNATQTLIDMDPMCDLPAANFFDGSSIDQMRRTLGVDISTADTYMGRPADCLGNLALRIEATDPVPGPTRDFLLAKLDDLSGAYNRGLPYGNVDGMGFFAMRGSAIPTATRIADFLDHGATGGLADVIIDEAVMELADPLQLMLRQIGYDRLGSSYFRGAVYSEGDIVAQNDVTVLGALLAHGDIHLHNGARVTFVEDLLDNPTAAGNLGGLTVVSWIGR